MNSKKPIFGIVMVFLLGILCGSLATHMFYSCRFDSFMHKRGEDREAMLVNRLERKLELDEKQMAQVRVIVHETHQGIETLRGQIRPQIEALIGKSQARINTILTPEQQGKFAKMIAERKERMRGRGHGND